jgi:hypothetical protein
VFHEEFHFPLLLIGAIGSLKGERSANFHQRWFSSGKANSISNLKVG